LLYKHLPLLFGSSGHVGFPILKTSLFINTKYYAMCGSNDGHFISIKIVAPKETYYGIKRIKVCV
jgi:hypothetical protein